MNVLVSGSHGLIGSAILARLRARGDRVTPLARPSSRRLDRVATITRGPVTWDPQTGRIDQGGLEGQDAVVHLAGASIGRIWTRGRKRQIEESRVRGTRLLCESLARCARPPRVLVSASAVGYYGSRGDAVLREDEPPGADFLARVSRAWEEETRVAADRGIRVVCIRTGVVLSGDGGLLPPLLPAFRLGLGATIGSGSQYMSWIALEDLARVYLQAIDADDLSGPLNAVAPEPVTNRDFTRALARSLRRPAPFRIPSAMLRLLLGEMAEALMLSSIRAVPGRLTAIRYPFAYPDLWGTLQAILH